MGLKIDYNKYITIIMTSLVIQDKRNECDRLIKCISSELPAILSKILGENVEAQDFSILMTTIRKNSAKIKPHGEFTKKDIKACKDARNSIYHQEAMALEELDTAMQALYKCQRIFGIQSPIVPLRVLACKTCKTVITRTAQPTVEFLDLSSNTQKITRAYDVQVWTVANHKNETASRENTWYDGWVWTYTYCAKCREQDIISPLGFRFDWAPEDRVDLTTNKIRYDLGRQAMVVVNTSGVIRDLTHVVSDGDVKRHRYALLETRLIEISE